MERVDIINIAKIHICTHIDIAILVYVRRVSITMSYCTMFFPLILLSRHKLLLFFLDNIRSFLKKKKQQKACNTERIFHRLRDDNDNVRWDRDKFELRTTVDVSMVAQFRHRGCAQEALCGSRFHTVTRLLFIHLLHHLVTFLD